MKPGGYSDSAADIAYVLSRRGHSVVTPVSNPDPRHNDGWSFPDTSDGIAKALNGGATVLWANTVLYGEHPLRNHYARPFLVVGQPLDMVQQWDDKYITNKTLRKHGIPTAITYLASSSAEARELVESRALRLPVVIKPVRGRGSEGVVVARSLPELTTTVGSHLATPNDAKGPRYGHRVMVEEFLPGREITITVMPPGRYRLDGRKRTIDTYWSLPAVERIGHHCGVAPYNGVVAVARNSRVVNDPVGSQWIEVSRQCQRAAALTGATAPIRIDCRAGTDDVYYLFDLNPKPNMTGAGRPGRKDQDSLTCIAARAIGWNYAELLENLIINAMPQEHITCPGRSTRSSGRPGNYHGAGEEYHVDQRCGDDTPRAAFVRSFRASLGVVPAAHQDGFE